MDRRLTAYVLKYLLEHRFESKAEMARQLGMRQRTIEKVFANLDVAKAGTIAFDKAIYYCAENHISLDSILESFIEEMKDGVATNETNQQAFNKLRMTKPLSLTTDGEEADSVFYIRNDFSCFHTGLYTRSYKAIYMCFDRNKRLNTLRKWCFKGFATNDSPWFKCVQLLPQRPAFLLRQEMTYYDPEWEIRVNAGHILDDEENVTRLPESIRTAWNLPLLLETAVELARRKALSDWNLAVPQMFQGRVQYLLPIHLTNMERPDLAMALSIMDGYYIGHTCLTLEMAYQNARLLARPTAGWLTQLVE